MFVDVIPDLGHRADVTTHAFHITIGKPMGNEVSLTCDVSLNVAVSKLSFDTYEFGTAGTDTFYDNPLALGLVASCDVFMLAFNHATSSCEVARVRSARSRACPASSGYADGLLVARDSQIA